jgi:hypothetical protein
MKPVEKYLLILTVAAVMVAPAGCKRSEDGEGSAERAGRKIDNALDKAGQETGKPMERVGESMQNAGEKMQDNRKNSFTKTSPQELDLQQDQQPQELA